MSEDDVFELSEDGVFEIPSPPKNKQHQSREEPAAFLDTPSAQPPATKFDLKNLAEGEYQVWRDKGQLHIVVHLGADQGATKSIEFTAESGMLNVLMTTGAVISVPLNNIGAVNLGAAIKKCKAHRSEDFLVLQMPI